MAGLMDFLSGGGDPTQGAGLMGMLANPQAAGLMGMAGGLLQASGPSRIPVSMGQALGAGFQGMGQGVAGAMQAQRELMQMRAMQGLMGMGGDSSGGAPSQSAPASASTPMAPVTGAANSAPLSGVSAGMGSFAPAPTDAAAGAAGAYSSAPQSAGPTIYGRTPQQLFQQGMLMNMAGIQGGGDLMRIAVEHDPTVAAMMPTDLTKMGVQGGMSQADIQAANRAGVTKANYIAPTALRTPIYADASGVHAVPADMIASAYGPMYDAQARAKANYETPQVYDPNAFGPGKGGMVYQTQTNVSDAARGGAPGVPGMTPFQNAIRTVESGGNPAAVNPASGATGSMQTMPSTLTNPGFGVMAARDNSPAELQRVGADYATAMQNRYGNDTDAAVAYNWGPQNADRWISAGRPWKMLPAETQNYVGQVHAQMQNYAQQPQGGARPMAAQPPMGATAAANSAQTASSKQMADSYKGLADSDASYQQSRGALTDMIALGKQMGPLDSGISKLPEGAHNWDSTVASYDKAHSTFVSNQYNALSAGTDASKGTVDSMVPSSDKPLDTKMHGLAMQLNNLDYRHLETQLMTPAFQAGDQKAYTTLSAQFHNIVKPEMMPTIMPIMQMNGPQQQAAVQAAVKANPAMRPAFEMMFNAGMLR